jgi:DNA helicase II / ATP-dependent DNA helicase PcrA
VSPPLDNPADDHEIERIVQDEERCLGRVKSHLANKGDRPERHHVDYDTQLLALRDEIAAARMEDVPPLLEQMERLQALAARQREITQGYVDPRSPYFGRMMLSENERVREVLIGRSTYLDARDGIRIVDWRDAPVSRLFYRYAEGDDYEETFGERDVEGTIVVRRSLTINGGELRRIVAPQGTFVLSRDGEWRLGGGGTRLAGGQGMALRAEQHHRPGKLGVGIESSLSEDKHLKEITALIDPRQFELITAPGTGLVVIQGGAGSGKTTIGLHRLAYLAYQDRRRFRPDKMLVIVFNQALARYIAQVLPALDVPGVLVRTYDKWAEKLRVAHLPELPEDYTDETPPIVTRVKKHPGMIAAMDVHVQAMAERVAGRLAKAIDRNHPEEWRKAVLDAWEKSRGRPLAHRLHGMRRWVESDPASAELSGFARQAVESVCKQALTESRDVVSAWAELLTDRQALFQALTGHTPGSVTEAEIRRVVDWCTSRCTLALTEVEAKQEEEPQRGKDRGKDRRSGRTKAERDDDDIDDRSEGIDGTRLDEQAALDREDDTLLLALHQRMRGPLLRGTGKDALVYEHVLVDEAQDLSPVELGVVMGTVSKGQSITLAGDVAQRLLMNNGFSGWKNLLGELGLSHVEVEPLRLAYRSTREILEVARAVLGPLADDEPPEATRTGAPVEVMLFAHSGDAVGHLAESLRELMRDEPLASVAVIARYPEQADIFHHGLRRAEVPYLRRVANQDFPFKPGIDVTDVRQVKGLEFDYVVLVEVNEASYPEDDEARHLLHIAITRAAHQLWLLATDRPSRLLPESLRDAAL